MKSLVVASNNEHKIVEIKQILEKYELEIKSLKEMNIDIDIVEDGKTFEENAEKKARAIYEYLIKQGSSDFIVMADDSGLSVDYLNGEPGVYSARYAGEHGDDDKNNEKLLNKLQGVPIEKRTAKFVCSICLIDDKGKVYNSVGEVKGYITEKLTGGRGFGYDPLFYYEGFKNTFSNVSIEEKNKISHRARALQEVSKILRDLL